jgi:hypothetical protein
VLDRVAVAGNLQRRQHGSPLIERLRSRFVLARTSWSYPLAPAPQPPRRGLLPALRLAW